MKKPWLSSAERRENKPVGRSVDRTASLCQQAARARRRGDRVQNDPGLAPPSPQPRMGTNVLRVTAFAMPILKRASRVTVLTVEGGAAVPGPTGEQLCRYLQLNDVPAKPLTVGFNGRVTGEAILAHANALGSARAALISLLSFSTISAGVAFGAPTPDQVLAS
jgi:hypothetical protein